MDVDMRLIEALGGHHGHHLQNPVPAQTGSNRFSEFASAVSGLTNLIRSNYQTPQGSCDSSYPSGHLSQDHSNRPQTSQPAATLQIGLSDHAILQSLRLDDDSLREFLGCNLSSTASTQEGLQNKDGTENNPHPQGSESLGIGRNSHDETLAEMQLAIAELSQPATRVNSPPSSIHGPGSFSEYSDTSPAARPDGLTREDGQSTGPAPCRGNSQALEMSPVMDVQSPQSPTRNSMGRARNSVSSSSKARQDDLYEDPAKAAERERVRGENRVRKKRWRESNQDRNKDNDLRCRVTKRGNKLWGPGDSEEKRLWMKHEFTRRRAKREAKERARAADETGLNMGAGSSSVFQAYNSSPPPPMSATNTSPIFGNFQRPFPISQEAATRVALKNLVSLLHPPNATLQNATLQNLDATKPQGFQAAPCGSGQGQPCDDLRGQRLGPHQPTEIQNIAPDTGSDCDNGNPPTLEGVAWPAPEETTLAYHDSSQGSEMVAALRMRFDAPTSATAGSESPKPLESPIPRWPGTGKDKSGFFETAEVKTELSEVPLEALQSTERLQNTQSVALVTSHQVIESVTEGLSGSDADASLPTNADGEPDMNDEALERLVAESGLHMDELLSGVMEPEAFTTSESSQPSVAHRGHGDIGDLVGHGSEESMSLDQINALLGYLTENMDLGEPVNTSSPHSTNLVSHDQVADLTQDTIAASTNNWRNRQYPSTPSANTISRGTKRCSPDDSSSLPKRICKPPQSPIALTQLQAILQSSNHSQPISRHYVSSSYASSFGNSENMNKRLMKPPPYRPASKPPSIGITTGPGSAATIHAKSNEHEKKVKSMGFPPLMAGMKPK